jgi:hypothetical protein
MRSLITAFAFFAVEERPFLAGVEEGRVFVARDAEGARLFLEAVTRAGDNRL